LVVHAREPQSLNPAPYVPNDSVRSPRMFETHDKQRRYVVPELPKLKPIPIKHRFSVLFLEKGHLNVKDGSFLSDTPS
jgi:hypothetical protein